MDFYRGLILAVAISIPFWFVVGMLLAWWLG